MKIQELLNDITKKGNSQKYQFKILNKKTGKFITSGYRSKSSWLRASAVYEVVKDITTAASYRKVDINDIEIIAIPKMAGEKIPATDFLNHFNDDVDREKKHKEFEDQRYKEIHSLRNEMASETGLALPYIYCRSDVDKIDRFVESKGTMISESAYNYIITMTGKILNKFDEENPYTKKD